MRGRNVFPTPVPDEMAWFQQLCLRLLACMVDISGKNQAFFLNILTSKTRSPVILYHKTKYNAFNSGLLISLHLLFYLEPASPSL